VNWGKVSITRRLIVSLTIGTMLFWCIAAIGSTYVFSEELNETFDLALRETAQRLLPLAIDDVASRDGREPRALARSLIGDIEYLNYQVSTLDGLVLLRTPEAFDAPPDLYGGAPRRGFRTVGDYRTYSETDEKAGITLVVSETTAHREEAIADSTKSLFLPLLLLIPFSALGIWLVVRSTLAPVKRLSSEIAARDGTNLAPILSTGQPVELQPIARAIGRLIERLQAALNVERAFAANSAHELRTPIAGALAQTQVLIEELGEGRGAPRAREVEGALRRLADLSEKLLQIARVDAGLGATATPVDLLAVLDVVIRDCRSTLEAPDRLDYRRPPGAKLMARMDMDAFAIAVRNLVDNADKHGTRGGRIEVELGEDRTVSVRNGGPVVPADQLPGLTRRFARGATPAAGSGLGLAIVAAIMEQSGGKLELLSPARGRPDGFEAILKLPK